MKKFLALILGLSTFTILLAQSPETMSYQAVIRDDNNQLAINQNIGLQISILQSTVDGTPVFIERHLTLTNDNGLITIEIGTGVVMMGDIATIDWNNGPYFIKTETDFNGGTTYTLSGVNQILSVPYALYANTAKNFEGQITVSQISDFEDSVLTETDPEYNAWDKDYNDLINQPIIPFVPTNLSEFTNDAGFLILENDGDPTNEIQSLSFSGTDLTLSGGNTIDLSSLSSATQLSESEVDAMVADNGYITSISGSESIFSGWDKNVSDDFSGSYDDLTDLPSFVGWDINSADDFDGNYNNLSNKPSFVGWDTNSADDFDGNYDNLSNKPSFTGWDTNSADDFDGNYNNLTNKPSFTGWDTNSSDDITGVTANNGLSGGGTSGNVSVGIADSGVTNARLASNAVNSAKIQDASILGSDIANSTITTSHLNFSPITNPYSGTFTATAFNATDDVIVADNLTVTTGFIKVGSPTLTCTDGDVVAVGDIKADYDLEAGDDIYVEDNAYVNGTLQVMEDVEVDGVIMTGSPSEEYDNGDIVSTDDIIADDDISCGGTKNFNIQHPNDSTKRIVYACIEGPEAGVYARGSIELVNGEATVYFEEHYTLVVNSESLTAQLTPRSAESKGLAIIELDNNHIIIKELNNGIGNYTVDYFIQGVRIGYEDFKVIRNVGDED